MTTHVLIACSKTKSIPASNDLIWKTKTNTKSWAKAWSKQSELVPTHQLYNGRAFQQQLALCQGNKETQPHILSAGAGLISIMGTDIPSYEATFQHNCGPSVTEWHLLPYGGVGKLELKPNDIVVSFAPPQYHHALLNDADIERISPHLVVPSTSPLASIATAVIPIHPRAKEVLEVASTDLNTAFLKTYISEGIEGFNRIQSACDELPEKVLKRAISDEELLEKVEELNQFSTIKSLVRHLRDDLLIKASYERISHARKIASKD
jgi:hypothetical protein